MFRLMYRNPFEDDKPQVVSTSADLEDLKKQSFTILWSLLSNKTVYDDDAIVYIEDLTTGKRF